MTGSSPIAPMLLSPDVATTSSGCTTLYLFSKLPTNPLHTCILCFPIMSHTRCENTSLCQDEDDSQTGPSPQGRVWSNSDPAAIPANHHSDGIQASTFTFPQQLICWSTLFIIACIVVDAMALSYLALLSIQNSLSPCSGDCGVPEEADLKLCSSYINLTGSTRNAARCAQHCMHQLSTKSLQLHISQKRGCTQLSHTTQAVA
jgi:hypothetical protein